MSDSGRVEAFYRLAGGRITEVWVAADNLALLRQISENPPT